MRKIIFAVVLGVVLSGCVATGVTTAGTTDRLAERSANFKEGKTTYKEVKAELGDSRAMAVTADGKRAITYREGYYSGNQLHLIFDKNDVLETKKLKD